MGVQFHAMTEKDYDDLGSYVKSTGTADTFGLLTDGLDSSLLFGEASHSSAICTSLDRLHKRSAIALTLPTFNFVLGRSGMSLLRKILGYGKDEWENILNIKLIMDSDTGETVNFEEADKNSRYLMGAQMVERLIDNFDIDKATFAEVENMVEHEMGMAHTYKEFGHLNKGSGDYHVVADYYLVIDKPGLVSASLKRGHSLDDLRHFIDYEYFDTAESRLTYLLNIPKDKSTLYGMLNKFIAVVPSEMRPKVQRREHKLTARYTSVITANNELRVILGGTASLNEVREKYLQLDRATSRLQYKNVSVKGTQATPDDLSILERIKSKRGQIRMRNLGKRQDNSFRSVVTVSPYLPLDMIELPECILPTIYETHIIPYLVQLVTENNAHKKNGEQYSAVIDKINLTDLRNEETQKTMLELIKQHKLLEKIPIPLGRQPTLHKHGIQAFYCKIVDSKAIGVNPLVCPGFNMDFDGDTAWGKIASRQTAIKELAELMLTTQNLYLAKSGECTIEPRQEMLYGLYVCTRKDYTLGKPVTEIGDLSDAFDAVVNHKVRVSDTITVGGKNYIAGEAAFISCFPRGTVVPSYETPGAGQLSVKEITSKTIGEFVNHLLVRDNKGELVHPLGTRYASTETFVGSINHLVMLGFKIAYFYTPSVSLLNEMEDIPEYDSAIEQFYKDMEPYDEVYDMGLETSENYKVAFDRCLGKMQSTFNKYVFDKLGPDNGYVLMSKSGARGKAANLTQMFAAKGQVKKNNKEVFDVLLEHCYAKQLTPMEHNIAGFGGRQGQMDKSLKTGDTGYASRKMWHTTQSISITERDCGTTEGITVSKNALTKFIDAESSNYISELRDMFAHSIVGKYTVDGELITEEKAQKYAVDDSVQKIVVRSPLTCKNTCCTKCYGINWETHRVAIVGANVGLVAAESIGELMSQLTLNNFHSGGVSGSGQNTSAFDKVDRYLHCSDIASASAKGAYAGYDPLAWDTGEVIVTPGTSVRENIVKIGKKSRKRIIVPSTLKLKDYAVKGEGLSYKHGDYDINEVMSYCGIEEAQYYLINKLYSLYKSECDVCMVHFEVIVAGMTRYMITKTDRDDLMVGQFYTRKELMRGSIKDTTFVTRLLSIQEIPLVSQDALDAILMENHSKGLSRICALRLTDNLDKPLNRMMLGLTIKNGSRVPGYVEERKDRV